MNESLRPVDGRWVLRTERRLSHPPKKVWIALTEPSHLGEWFPADMEMDLRVGGKIRFVFRDGEGPASDGVITQLDPPRIFAYSWGNDLFRWELEPDGDGCLLTLTNTLDDRPAAASYAAGWQICIDALEMVLDGAAVEVRGDWVELHERFVKAFGLDEGVVETTPDGWRVRFERQLTQPVDRVWSVLTSAGQKDQATGQGEATGGPAVGDPLIGSIAGGLVPDGFAGSGITAGSVTATEPPELLEYAWSISDCPMGRIRWELSSGNGGARLVVSQTGAGSGAQPDCRQAAFAAWKAHIERLAERLARSAHP